MLELFIHKKKGLNRSRDPQVARGEVLILPLLSRREEVQLPL